MIVKIKKIEKFGIFEDFSWNSNINEFKKYNLIYGWNYSGKTTLSRIFRVLETGKLLPDFNNAKFILVQENGKEISQGNFSNIEYDFRVFNVDFVEENLYWDTQEANPLFVLGEKDIELEKQMKELNSVINQLENEKEAKEKEMKKLNSEIEKMLSDKARELDRIKSPYDKRKIKKVMEGINDENVNDFYLSKIEIKNIINQLYEKKEKIQEVRLKILEESFLDNISETVKKTVVSEVIERLKNNPRINNWIREGLEIHKGKEICEFCGNPLDENLLRKYENHFSDEYSKFIEKLNSIKKRVDIYKKEIEFIKLPDEKRFYSNFEHDFIDLREEFNNIKEEYLKVLEEIIKILEIKINNPFESTDLSVSNVFINKIKEIVRKFNELIKNHNKLCDEHEKMQKELFKKLEKHFAAELIKDNKYLQKNEKLKEVNAELNKIVDQINENKERLKSIESKLSDIFKAANEINYYLNILFYKKHLKIVPKEKNRFQILRGKNRAKYLSEGEKTAIAFSYFLTKLKDKDTNLNNTIVFVDDPVSSLDSFHIYSVYSLITSELENCRQFFISTHNLEFFNLIKDWMKKSNGKKRSNCELYIIERVVLNEGETSKLRNLPETLFKYKSEYHYLFSKIKGFHDNTSGFDSLYQMPNIIRKFLEAFVGFKYSTNLKNGLEKLISNESERIKINKFINEFSHQKNLNRSLMHHDLSECLTVIDIVLKTIKEKDLEHYETLEKIFNEFKNN